jgi:glycosyltransferase involved in cell wall biosynthesis
MKFNTLSVIIPVFNEAATIHLILDKVRQVDLPAGIGKELVIVNDCSTDNTREAVKEYMDKYPDLAIHYHELEVNSGKGAALHAGIGMANGELLIIQDADLEYDPADYGKLLQPVLEGEADVVYGSRFKEMKDTDDGFSFHRFGNGFLTSLSNLFTGLALTDMETCYKLFPADLIKGVKLKEKRFGFEPEVTAKISRIPGIRFAEVPISYYGRTYSEGKKIGWKDGVRAIYCILKYGLAGRNHSMRTILG